MTGYRIEPGVPLPPRGRLRADERYGFGRMKAGDSFTIPAEECVKTARVYANRHAKLHPGWSYTTRKEGTGWRLWCVTT